MHFWGDDCSKNLLIFLETLKPHIIYAHNGGKFDFHFLLDKIDNPIKIIGGRIAKAKMLGHELRDSYSIIPIPLSAYIKDSIDYKKLERNVREKNKAEIIAYLKTDCLSLHDIVSKFIARFGLNLTIGGTAMKMLKATHPFDPQRGYHDKLYRPYYFGGRVEAIKTGILRGDWRVYDVNSMYPHVMRELWHPTGGEYVTVYNRAIDKHGRIAGIADAKFYFAKIRCENFGAFPIRVKNEPLNFTVKKGEFCVTSHELKAAIKCGRAKNITVLEAHAPLQYIKFKQYVDKFVGEKIDCKTRGDKAGEIFAKLLLNSPYGKFGQNPEHYYDYWVGEPENPDIYELYSADPHTQNIWRKKAEAESYYDVATAASVTGAARAMLMLALDRAKNPVYCDTDSIICEGLDLEVDDKRLGAWKLEALGDKIAIAGKKMYALKDGKKIVKTASKGVVLTGEEIFELCGGKDKHWQNDAPAFSLGKKRVKFVHRKIKGVKIENQ